jgi:hypothetical protein
MAKTRRVCDSFAGCRPQSLLVLGHAPGAATLRTCAAPKMEPFIAIEPFLKSLPTTVSPRGLFVVSSLRVGAAGECLPHAEHDEHDRGESYNE